MYSNIFGKYCVLRLRDKDGSLQADGRRSRNSFRSEKGKRTVQTGKVVRGRPWKAWAHACPVQKGSVEEWGCGAPVRNDPFPVGGARSLYLTIATLKGHFCGKGVCALCWFITSGKGKSPENKRKNLLPTGRQKKAVYFRGALVSLASVGGRHCPRQGFLFSARVHEVNRFFLSATKKKRNTEKREKGKAKRKLEMKEKKGNLVEEKNPECTENYSQNTSLTNSARRTSR